MWPETPYRPWRRPLALVRPVSTSTSAPPSVPHATKSGLFDRCVACASTVVMLQALFEIAMVLPPSILSRQIRRFSNVPALRHRIDRTDRCTKCDGHEWFSHRGKVHLPAPLVDYCPGFLRTMTGSPLKCLKLASRQFVIESRSRAVAAIVTPLR